MGRVENQLKKITEKCKILYKEQIISTPNLLQAYTRYLSITFNKQDHNIGLVLHTDSICFDILTITFSAIVNLLSNETSSEDFINNLVTDSMVLYKIGKKTERCRFNGKLDLNGYEYITLTQDKKDGKETFLVPPSLRCNISPYNGTSKREDGRGIRSKNNEALETFFKEVLEVNKEDIPNVFDTSSIIIAPKDLSACVKDISISFGEYEFPLTSLITAAYFTGNIEQPFYLGTNPGKTEVLLKFVSKVSTARALMRNRDGNRHLGVMVLGNQIIHRNESELPNLINKKTLKYIYLSSSKNSVLGYNLLQENEEVSLFACAKKFVEKYDVNTKNPNPLLVQLKLQVETICKQEIKTESIDSILNWELYVSFKKALSILRQNDYESDEKETFIKYAFSIMKIFTTSVFPLKDLENYNISIKGLTIKGRIEELRKLEEDIPSILRDKTHYVINTLELLYDSFYLNNLKAEKLKKLIVDNRGKKIAIIVPKSFYISVLHYCVTFDSPNLYFYTVNNFDNTVHYDMIIVSGLIEGSKFTVLDCNSSELIVPILYEHEIKKFKYEKRLFSKINRFYLSRLTLKSKSFLVIEEPEEDINEEEIKTVNEIDSELNNYISDIDLNIGIKHFALGIGSKNSIMSDIKKAATFTDGSKALFTEHYKAYVFDVDEESIKETEINDLSDGDSIVFTKNNDETKDIVDTILKQLISENKLQKSTVDAYEKSKKWKQNLHYFMKENNLTPRKLFKVEKDKSLNVTELTIRTWMDEDSHTVGPKESDSIRRIAKLTNDEEMMINSEDYFQACVEIRRLRRNILNQITKAIIDRLSGKASDEDIIAKTIYDKIENLAVILEIESIVPFEKTVPLYIANRPLNI